MVKRAKKAIKKPKDRFKLRQRVKIKAKEIPALLRAKREEKKHIPTFKELRKETKEFEKEGLSLRKLILRKPKKVRRNARKIISPSSIFR